MLVTHKVSVTEGEESERSTSQRPALLVSRAPVALSLVVQPPRDRSSVFMPLVEMRKQRLRMSLGELGR